MRTKILLVVLLGGSLVVNFFLLATHRQLSRMEEISRFFSAVPTKEAAIEKFGSPVETFQNSKSITQSGWTLPPWSSEKPILVFLVFHEFKVYAELDEQGRLSRYWIGTS